MAGTFGDASWSRLPAELLQVLETPPGAEGLAVVTVQFLKENFLRLPSFRGMQGPTWTGTAAPWVRIP